MKYDKSFLRNKSLLIRKKKYDKPSALRKIYTIDAYEEIVSVDLVIEAVSEDINTKADVFKKIRSIVSEETIIASNTSSLSITQLASFTEYPSQVIGIHFFNPIDMMRLTEIVYGYHTSKLTIEWAKEFTVMLDKVPVVVKESPGLIVNRMLIPMINEAVSLLSEGVASNEEIDRAMKMGANHPIGPLALSDMIGNDVVLSIMQNLHFETGDQKYRPHSLLKKMVRAGALGRKTSLGFYKY